jgi:AcrR family transcriptional regulator
MARPVTKLNAIEYTAISLFAARGIKEVTIRDIARQAGCSEGALYRHFVSKDEMAWLLYKREVEKLGLVLADILNQDGTFSERLRKSVDLFYTFFDKEPDQFKFILLSEYNFPIESRVNPDLNPYNLVFEFVEQGIKKGEFRVKNPKLCGAMILGIVMQPASLKASGRLSGRMKEKVKDVVDACIRVLKAD